MLSLQALHDSQIPVSKVMVRRSAQVGAVIFGGWLLISLILYSGRPNQELVRVAAIQPALSPIVLSNRGEDITSLYQQMIRQSRKAAGQGARLIVWPEGALSWDPQVEDKLELANLARDTNSYLATGYVVVVGTEGFRNEATVINPQGQFLGIFGKDHPVVFGGETSLSRGSYPVYNTDIGTLATIICYDLDYTDTTRRMVEQGAQIIATPSNDWGSIADKHYTHVVFRAIENRVAMVKADGGYNSAIIDPYGHIIELAVFPEGGEATLVADLLPGDGRGTINTRFGDWVGWIALGGLLFFTFGSRWLIKNNNTDVPNNNPREQG
jgi:apolipoprotein N-acyltransferase